MFWETYCDLCKKQGATPSEIIAKLNLSTGCVTKWKNGSIPNKKTLEKLANYFNVTKEYFFISHENTTNNQIFISYQGTEENHLPEIKDELLEGIIESYYICNQIGRSDIYQYAKTKAAEAKEQRKES